MSEATKLLSWEVKHTAQTPLWSGNYLPEVTRLKDLCKWSTIGIDLLGDVWQKGDMLDFPVLQKEYQMGNGEFLHYQQHKHAIQSHIHSGDQLPEYTPLEDRLLLDPMINKAISLTYRKLINNTTDPLGPLCEKWESDVGMREDDDWGEALQCPREVAVRTRFRLVQLRILDRSYTPRTTQHRIGFSVTEYCLRGCREVGTFFHILGDCTRIHAYWSRLSAIMFEVIGAEVPIDAR